MFWILVGALISYLVIGVVYTLVRWMRECGKRMVRLGNAEKYGKWIGGIEHIDYTVDELMSSMYIGGYDWYFRFMDSILDAIDNDTLFWVIVALTWPTGVPACMDLILMAMDRIYEKHFGEEEL